MGANAYNDQAPGLNGAGPIEAVVVDAIKAKNVNTQWGIKNQLTLALEIAGKNDNGYNIILRRTYTDSLHEKSALRADLERWFDRSLTAEELENGIDWPTLVGKSCRVEVTDAISSTGNAYLKVVKLLPSGETVFKPSGFYRRWEPKKNGGAA